MEVTVTFRDEVTAADLLALADFIEKTKRPVLVVNAKGGQLRLP